MIQQMTTETKPFTSIKPRFKRKLQYDNRTQNFTNPSILSGDFNDDDVITGSGSTLNITGNSENTYHVLITQGLTAEAVIEGFLITGGHANGSGSISYSGVSFLQ